MSFLSRVVRLGCTSCVASLQPAGIFVRGGQEERDKRRFKGRVHARMFRRWSTGGSLKSSTDVMNGW
jgi:hypothetical protein